MTDIVIELRGLADMARECRLGVHIVDPTPLDAAAIEVETLRRLGDTLVAVMRSGSDTGWDDAIDAWEELTRGVDE